MANVRTNNENVAITITFAVIAVNVTAVVGVVAVVIAVIVDIVVFCLLF